MNSKRYKLAVLIEIILLLILASVSYLNPFWSAKNPLQIDIIHPNEFYIALSLLFFIIPISFLIAITITSVFKQKKTPEISGEPSEIKNTKQSLFWKYTFYSSFYFSFGFLIFSIFTRFTSEHPALIYEVDTFFQNFLVFLLGILLLSFFIGALFLGTTTLRKNNKLSAFILTIVIVLFFISPFLVVSKYHQHCENIKPEVNTDSLSEEFTFYEEEGEGEGEYGEGEISFAHLWDDSSEDEQNVSTALEHFFLRLFVYPFQVTSDTEELKPINERGDLTKMNTYMLNEMPESLNLNHYLVYYPVSWTESLSEETNKDDKDNYFLASIIAEIREQPESVDSYFEKYNHLLYTLIDKKIYKKSSLERVIKLLLTTHKDLNSSGIAEEDKEKLYRKFAYNESLGRNDSDYAGPSTQLDKMEAFYSESGMDKIRAILTQDSYQNFEFYNVTFWAYSFWIRRHHDGNEEQVYEILTQIDEHYEE